MPAPDIRGTAFGYHEIRDKVPVLTRVHMAYRLNAPVGSRDTVERALARHAARCPTAVTLKGAVSVTWEAEVHEGDAVWKTDGARD